MVEHSAQTKPRSSQEVGASVVAAAPDRGRPNGLTLTAAFLTP